MRPPRSEPPQGGRLAARRAWVSPRRLLEGYGLRHKRHFGQNFLSDERLAQRIAELATTPPGGTAVEIGAGLGALTRPLLARAAKVVAIERDRDLVPVLRAELGPEIESGRLSLIEGDAKGADYPGLLALGPRPHVVTGNLPYQITGPLLERTVAIADAIERAVYMVQLEVAERLTAKVGTGTYGALTVFLQARFEVQRAFTVGRGAFHPQPGVDSAVVVLIPLAEPIARETRELRELVRSAFQQRRKMLRNAWQGVLGLPDAALRDAAGRAGIDLSARGETLDAAAFGRMAAEVRR